MPPDLKLRGFKRKYILKRALEKRCLMTLFGERRPVSARRFVPGCVDRCDRWLMIYFRKERSSDEAYFGRRKSDASSTQNSGREDYNLQVFQLLNLELWQRQFIDN